MWRAPRTGDTDMEHWAPTIETAPYAPDSCAVVASGGAAPLPEIAVFGEWNTRVDRYAGIQPVIHG